MRVCGQRGVHGVEKCKMQSADKQSLFGMLVLVPDPRVGEGLLALAGAKRHLFGHGAELGLVPTGGTGTDAVAEQTPANLRELVDELSFEQLVSTYYQPLYRFALGLCGQENDAWDLTQQTFYRWATKGQQLRDKSKVKSWLFTTLHREFLNARRRGNRFPHLEVDSVAHELPPVPPSAVAAADGATVLAVLNQMDEIYRAPLLLFFLEDRSYRKIAEILEIPDGTVMSRISRGKAILRHLLADPGRDAQAGAVPSETPTKIPTP